MANDRDLILGNPAAHEVARLEALHSYGILNTPRELEYDEIVASIRRIFDVPVAFISLVAEHYQWFKAESGLGVCETPREASFCNYTILGQTPLVVEDTLLDARFCNNPYVVGEPNVRFYAGAPLITPQGYCVGTLCAADLIPRKPTERQLAGLVSASSLIVRFLEARKVLYESFRYGETMAKLNKGLGAVLP